MFQDGYWLHFLYGVQTALFAQGRGHDKQDKHGKKSIKLIKRVQEGIQSGLWTPRRAAVMGAGTWLPRQEPRLFPDYYTFYDPRRNGYVYWNNNAWQVFLLRTFLYGKYRPGPGKDTGIGRPAADSNTGTQFQPVLRHVPAKQFHQYQYSAPPFPRR